MSDRGRGVVYGTLGGAIGAACMTVIRLAGRRHALIEKAVPQAVEEWLATRVTLPELREPAMHHVLDQAIHIGYGAMLGAIYGSAVALRSGRPIRGLGYGAVTWLFGSWLLMPLLGVKRPPWRKRLAENTVDLLAHLVYGGSLELVQAEMQAQKDHLPSSDQRRRAERVG